MPDRAARLRLLYVYPEEWTGGRAREIQTLETCLALAALGAEVDLVTAGGAAPVEHARALGHATWPPSLHVVPLSRRLGPLRSARFFAHRLAAWLAGRRPDVAYAIHPKAAAALARLDVPFWYEAHEVLAESSRPRIAGRVAALERLALEAARGRVATSAALADALTARYFPGAPRPFAIVPNAGRAPLLRGVAEPGGPLAYAGSLGDWKGVPLALEGAARLGLPVRVVGGTAAEWERLAGRLTPAARAGVEWRPRVPLADLPAALAGCRAGLVPTLPESGSGRYSCPMKLFDYARCGLPVVVTDLPSLASLDVGPWCVRVPEATVDAWARTLALVPWCGDEPRVWAARNTWTARARALLAVFERELDSVPRTSPTP